MNSIIDKIIAEAMKPDNKNKINEIYTTYCESFITKIQYAIMIIIALLVILCSMNSFMTYKMISPSPIE